MAQGNINKANAIRLIDEKIKQFKEIYDNVTYDSRYDPKYQKAYYGTELLLKDLFSVEEAQNFVVNVTSSETVIGSPRDKIREIGRYKKHIQDCVVQLELFRERIFNMWPEDSQQKNNESDDIKPPFVSMSFEDSDKEINEYFCGILKALKIEYITEERYSSSSVPEKVKKRIEDAGLIITIFVKHDVPQNTRPWLIGETKYAQGAGKDVIAIVEYGVTQLAGLNSEKELVLFKRGNAKRMQDATTKLLEALKEHGLI